MSRRDRLSTFSRPSERHQFARIVTTRNNNEVSDSRVQNTPNNTVKRKGYVLPSRTLNKPNPTKKTPTKSSVLNRHGLKKLPKYKPEKKSNRKYVIIGASTMAVIAITALTGIFAYWGITKGTKIVAKKHQTEQVNTAPQSLVMGAQHNQSWVPDQPSMLYVDRMDLTADIKPVGGSETEIQPPQDINEIGWFEGSDKPGTGGTVVITGYVSRGGMPGAINRLNMLGVGDNIQIRTKDGQIHNYKIYKTKAYDRDAFDMSEILNSVIPSREGLNLITFTDKYDVRVQRFEQRIVVFAVKD